MTLAEWYEALTVHAKEGGWFPVASIDCYIDYYESGETPEDALADEMSYAGD